MYKDKEKQREANRLAAKRSRAKGMTQGMTEQGMTQEIVIPDTIKDCNGVEHPIDFEGRRRDHELLESWYDGKGSVYQRRLGQLARDYNIIRDENIGRFLGVGIDGYVIPKATA